MVTLAIVLKYWQNMSKITKYMSKQSRDAIFAAKRKTYFSTTSPRSCNLLKPSIYREPMVALDQLVTLSKFMEKPVNWLLENPWWPCLGDLRSKKLLYKPFSCGLMGTFAGYLRRRHWYFGRSDEAWKALFSHRFQVWMDVLHRMLSHEQILYWTDMFDQIAKSQCPHTPTMDMIFMLPLPPIPGPWRAGIIWHVFPGAAYSWIQCPEFHRMTMSS
jgi:hypothetical protein